MEASSSVYEDIQRHNLGEICNVLGYSTAGNGMQGVQQSRRMDLEVCVGVGSD